MNNVKPLGIRARSPGRLIILCIINLLVGCSSAAKPVPERGMSEALFAVSAQADHAYNENRWLDAARDYQRISELVPQDPYAWFRLGNVYARQGLFDKATSAYKSAIDRDPLQPKPWYNLATTHLLNAQFALRESHTKMRPIDPARQLIEQQLLVLDSVIYQRLEDLSPPGQGLR